MRELIIILSIIVFSYTVGYMSGYWKRKKTENHFFKYLFWLSICGIAYYNFELSEVVGMLLMIRLFHDVGWTQGMKIDQLIYIGNSEIIDKCWRWLLKLTNYNQGFKSKIVFAVYVFMAFIGIGIIINSKYMMW